MDKDNTIKRFEDSLRANQPLDHSNWNFYRNDKDVHLTSDSVINNLSLDYVLFPLGTSNETVIQSTIEYFKSRGCTYQPQFSVELTTFLYFYLK